MSLVKLQRRIHCWTDRFDLLKLVSANSAKRQKKTFLVKTYSVVALREQNSTRYTKRFLTLLNTSRTIRLLRLIRFCRSFSSLDTISGSLLYRFRVCCFKAFVVNIRLPAAINSLFNIRAFDTSVFSKKDLPIVGGFNVLM